jgi:tRNA A37 threonylcarbamoyladenosine modification protein TsaB
VVLGTELLQPAGRHEDDLMAAIDRLTRRVGIGPPQIERVAVSIGPGGYTALRIAIATAKMIAEATGARTIAVPTAEVAARLVSPGAGAPGFAVVLGSKAQTAFVTMFGPDRRKRGPGQVVDASGFQALIGGAADAMTVVADRHIPDSFRRITREAGLHFEGLRLSAQACLEASVCAAEVDPVGLAPLYGREPEAVTLWRTRKS